MIEDNAYDRHAGVILVLLGIGAAVILWAQIVAPWFTHLTAIVTAVAP